MFPCCGRGPLSSLGCRLWSLAAWPSSPPVQAPKVKELPVQSPGFGFVGGTNREPPEDKTGSLCSVCAVGCLEMNIPVEEDRA
ncbi:unnamed protein product [Fusarium graminearum]|nr:unnamed protein product [Fusarium graminearum]